MKNYSKHYQAKIKGLQEENASLKAEVEQIRKNVDEHLTPIPEHTTVMEVERFCTAWSLMSNSLDAQWKRIEQLKAENKRLRKAGDAMAAHILKIEEEVYEVTPCGGYYVIDEWNAAKEGKPSA